MHRLCWSAFAAFCLVSLVPVSSARADRWPDPDERALVESALNAQGFVRWDEIEWDDDGVWEVDDAVGIDGRVFDLALDATMTIVMAEPD